MGWRARRSGSHVAPAVINARRATFVFCGVHSDRCRYHADTGRLETLEPDFAVSEGLHRRHRIRRTRRPPNLLRLGIAGPADVLRALIVIWRNVLVGNRPFEAVAVPRR